jgi:pentatricopeptide repeat protein
MVGVVGIAIFAVKAERRRADAQLIADFLENDILGSLRRAKIGEATATYMLDAASESLEGKFKDRPLIEASIREKLGWTYRTIGVPEKAERHFLRAIEIYQQHLGEDHPSALRAAADIGWVYEDQGRYHELERLWTKNLQLRQRVSGVQDQTSTMNALATTYFKLGKYEEAESLFDKILQLVQHELGGANVWIRCNLANVYAAQGRYKEAERMFVETLEDAEWPEEFSSWEFVYTTELANMYTEQGRYGQAEPLFDKALATLRLMTGNEHQHTLMSMYGLVRLYVDQDRYNEAEKLFGEALSIARRRLREDHPLTLQLVNTFAVLRTKQEQYDQAEKLFVEALKGRHRELGTDHPDTLETKNDLAILYKEQDDYDSAEPLLLEALKGRRLKLGDTHPHTIESWNHLIDLYEAWGKPEKADQWRAKLEQIEAIEG